MRKATLMVAVVIALALFAGCATVKMVNGLLNDKPPTIVIVAGASSLPGQLEVMHKAFPNSVVIVPEKYYPLGSAADDVLRQIRSRGITGRLILIGHSWGGIIVRRLDARNPGLVVAVITITTPNYFKFTPDSPALFSLRSDDAESKTPLYVIAGRKIGAPRYWWMRTDDSDGVVDILSVMDLGKKANGVAIVNGDHSELVEKHEVIDQIQAWLKSAL